MKITLLLKRAGLKCLVLWEPEKTDYIDKFSLT